MMGRVGQWFSMATVAAGLLVASACAAGDAPQAKAEDATETAVGEEESASSVSYDPETVQKRVLDLYITRQEYIELYWGVNGRLTAGDALGVAVESSEARFHDLMALLGKTPPPPAARVAEAATAVIDAHEVVLEEARAAGVSLDATAADSLIKGTPAGGLEEWIAEVRAGLENLPLGSAAPESGS